MKREVCVPHLINTIAICMQSMKIFAMKNKLHRHFHEWKRVVLQNYKQRKTLKPALYKYYCLPPCRYKESLEWLLSWSYDSNCKFLIKSADIYGFSLSLFLHFEGNTRVSSLRSETLLLSSWFWAVLILTYHLWCSFHTPFVAQNCITQKIVKVL